MKKTIILLLALFLLSACSSTSSSSVVPNVSPKETITELAYYDECPELPKVESAVSPINNSGNSKSSVNGKTTKISYYYNDLSESDYNKYLNFIKEKGVTLKESDEGMAVIVNDEKAATISFDGSRLNVDIVPNENRVVSKSYDINFGETVSLDFVEFYLDEYEINESVLPVDTSGVYLEYDATEGNQYVIARGNVKNLHSDDIDSRYIDAYVTLNGKYTYDCDVTFGANPASMTDYAITPFESCPLYFYAMVPNDALNTAGDSIVLTINFNDNFERIMSDPKYSYSLVLR